MTLSMGVNKFSYQSVIDFWFTETKPEQWWKKDESFDVQIRERFGVLYQSAITCELFAWRTQGLGRLAEIIVLDQFPRNMFRGTAASFSSDAQALSLSQEAVLRKVPEQLTKNQRAFLLMPYMHSESLRVHEEAERLFRQYAPDNLDFEIKHKTIIERFGRYPHRNSLMGRNSTPEEVEFLKGPGSSF